MSTLKKTRKLKELSQMKRIGKIIQIDKENSDATILIEGNNQSEHYSLNSFNFSPMIGDKAEIIPDGDSFIISNYTDDVLQDLPGHKKVNKMVYILLAFFLGGIGGHKFYSGKIGLGVVYLIFCWTFIPLIISFIEAILALGKTADQNGEMYI